MRIAIKLYRFSVHFAQLARPFSPEDAPIVVGKWPTIHERLLLLQNILVSGTRQALEVRTAVGVSSVCGQFQWTCVKYLFFQSSECKQLTFIRLHRHGE